VEQGHERMEDDQHVAKLRPPFLVLQKFHVVQAEEWIGRKHAGLM
jgi:hypothetical protein